MKYKTILISEVTATAFLLHTITWDKIVQMNNNEYELGCNELSKLATLQIRTLPREQETVQIYS